MDPVLNLSVFYFMQFPQWTQIFILIASAEGISQLVSLFNFKMFNAWFISPKNWQQNQRREIEVILF